MAPGRNPCEPTGRSSLPSEPTDGRGSDVTPSAKVQEVIRNPEVAAGLTRDFPTVFAAGELREDG